MISFGPSKITDYRVPRENSKADRSVSSSQIVVDKLIQAIQEGRYAPGQRLISTDIAKSLGLSRAPVREALQRLAGEGVVSLTPNRGATIRRLEDKDILDMLVFLRTCGALGIELATPTLVLPAKRKAVENAAAELMKIAEKRNALRWINALVDFHYTINELSENMYINLAMKNLHVPYHNRVLSEVLPGLHWEEYIGHYRDIVKAMLAGDARLAVKLYSNHMAWVIKLWTAEAHSREQR